MSEWRIVTRRPSMGRTRWLIQCPHCFDYTWVYPWSFSGHGSKKCGHCPAVFKFNPPLAVLPEEVAS